MSLEDKYMIRRLAALRRWREFVEAVARAAKDLLGEGVEVYVVGGAAEGRLTALSDIDVVIVTPKAPLSWRDRLWLAVDIRDRAYTSYGLPLDYPVDIKVMTPEEFAKARERYYKRVIRLG